MTIELTNDEWLREEIRYEARTRWTAAELMACEFPEPRWAVPGLIAEGTNLLAGAPKLGKSWLALNIAVAVASGGCALGRVPVDAGDVLYLALEDTGRRLQSRLRAVLGDDPVPERLTLETSCPAIGEGGAALINAWLGDHPHARLVIIDVFTRVRGQVNDRSGMYEADYGAMSAIKALADEWGVAFLVVHHTRKASAEDFLDSVSGTHGLAGAADAVLILSRSRGSASATLKVTGRDVEEAEHALDFAADIGTWKLLDGPASDYALSSERRLILEAVRAEEGIGPKRIAERTGLSHDVVKQLVRKMLDVLDTDGSGAYFPVHPVHSIHPVTGMSEHSERSERVDATHDRARGRAADGLEDVL